MNEPQSGTYDNVWSELCSSVSVDLSLVHALVGFVLQPSIQYWKTSTADSDL